jgi:hypothetical protein
MKHTDKELIHRLPIFITTNHNLWNWVSSDDIPPIQQRIFEFHLTQTIESLNTQTAHIPQPPSIITKHDLYHLIATHLKEIDNAYAFLLSSQPLASNHKHPTETSKTTIQHKLVQSLLQDNDFDDPF